MKYLTSLRNVYKKYQKQNIPISICLQKSFQELIEKGIFEENSVLPLEKDIAALLKIGHITARKAFQKLETLGYIQRNKRIGITIKSNYLYQKTGIGLRIGIVFWTQEAFYNASHYSKDFFYSFCKQALVSNIEIVPIPCTSEEDIIKIIKAKNTDGIIIFPDKDVDYYKKTKTLEIPKILYECSTKRKDYDNTFVDPSNAYKEALEDLIKKGNKKFSFLIGVSSDIYKEKGDEFYVPENAIARLRSFTKCLASHQIKYDPKMTFQVSYDQKEMDAFILKLVKSKKLPHVIFTYNDHIASNLIKSLNSMNIRIPQDISIIGFGHYAEEFSMSNLSTIRPNWEEMANKIIKRVVECRTLANIKNISMPIQSCYIKNNTSQ